MSKASKDDHQKPELHQAGTADRDQTIEKWGTLNVLGLPAEPICTYYRCRHKFSLHGSRKCRCKHPENKTLGIQIRYTERILSRLCRNSNLNLSSESTRYYIFKYILGSGVCNGMESPLRRGDPRLSGYLLNPNHTLSLLRSLD